MPLYLMQADDWQAYVEAPTMIEAITIWVAAQEESEVEPESVSLVHDDPVLRKSEA